MSAFVLAQNKSLYRKITFGAIFGAKGQRSRSPDRRNLRQKISHNCI